MQGIVAAFSSSELDSVERVLATKKKKRVIERF